MRSNDNSKMKHGFMLLSIIVFFSSCNTRWGYVSPEQIGIEQAREKYDNCCNQWENYAPYEEEERLIPTRYIRMNIHYVLSAEEMELLDKKQGIRYAKRLVRDANEQLNKNAQMWLPHENETPVLPLRYQYVITPDENDADGIGVYFHQDDELYYMVGRGKNRNIGDSRVMKKYGVDKDSTVNVFLLEHNKDSMQSKSYRAINMGVALGSWIKLLGIKWADDNENEAWFRKQLLSHEVGHVLGLMHSWIPSDRCEDTPPNPNCWDWGAGRCEQASNNVMDYNAHRTAWSPCQIGVMHKNMTAKNSRQRKLLIKDWCELDETKDIIIRGEEVWRGARDIKGNIILQKGAKLWIRCRVSLPKGARIMLHEDSELKITGRGMIHNDCGSEWDGIVLPKSKKARLLFHNQKCLQNCKHNPFANSTNE